MPSEVERRTIWRTAAEQGELVIGQFTGYHVRLWVRSRLVLDETVDNLESVRTSRRVASVRGVKVFRLLVAAAVVNAALGCGTRESRIAHLSAPDPRGCFAEVFEQEHFAGPREFINGPAEYARLTELPFGARWRDRIRSVRVGSAATFSAWAAENFEGASLRYGPDRTQPRLPEGFSGKIGSLKVECKTE